MQLRWTRITALALAIAAAPSLALWNESKVDREYHALYMLLLRTRARAMQDGPITVRFNGRRAIMEDRNGTLRSRTGHDRSLWVHCSGGVTGGRNDTRTLKSLTVRYLSRYLSHTGR